MQKKRRCEICGAFLSIYNPKKICFCHKNWEESKYDENYEEIREENSNLRPYSFVLIIRTNEWEGCFNGGKWKKKLSPCP